MDEKMLTMAQQAKQSEEQLYTMSEKVSPALPAMRVLFSRCARLFVVRCVVLCGRGGGNEGFVSI